MTTIEALQNLYEALGGEASAVENINTIPAMLSEISGQLSGGGEDSKKQYIVKMARQGSQLVSLTPEDTVASLIEKVNDGYDLVLDLSYQKAVGDEYIEDGKHLIIKDYTVYSGDTNLVEFSTVISYDALMDYGQPKEGSDGRYGYIIWFRENSDPGYSDNICIIQTDHT